MTGPERLLVVIASSLQGCTRASALSGEGHKFIALLRHCESRHGAGDVGKVRLSDGLWEGERQLVENKGPAVLNEKRPRQRVRGVERPNTSRPVCARKLHVGIACWQAGDLLIESKKLVFDAFECPAAHALLNNRPRAHRLRPTLCLRVSVTLPD